METESSRRSLTEAHLARWFDMTAESAAKQKEGRLSYGRRLLAAG
jgi:hypothetical protein